MFSVKGWSLSADELKSESASATPIAEAPKSRKRKRSGASAQKVTASNVAELWEKVIEHKDASGQDGGESKPAGGQKKRQKVKDETAAAVAAATAEGHKKSESQTLSKKERQQQKKKAAKEEEHSSQNPSAVADDEEWDGLDDGDNHPDEPSSEVAKAPKPRGKENDSTTKTTKNNKKSAKSKKDKKNKKSKPTNGEEEDTQAPDASSRNTSTNTSTDTNTAKLTPLQASMREKLVSARFRHINETLYTRPSADAFGLFRDAPEMFAEYHEGFRRQVGVWPENPVSGYIADLKARGKVRFLPRGRTDRATGAPDGPDGHGDGGSSAAVVSLPRTNGTCTVADLGCGDAALAAALQPLARRLRLEVKSFDLQSASPLVTRADIADLPLPDGSVDVAVFCLALMGTNWLDFVEEAYRVLRWKGELWVAEIKSRFMSGGGKKQQQQQRVVEHSVGNRKKVPAGGGGAKKGGKDDTAGGAADETELAVEVDGAEDRRQETDVSAFVEALQKRGFLLRGEPSQAVDLRNKMFVKMYFVKAAVPVRGKGVAAAAARPGGAAEGGGRGGAMKMRKKFITSDEDDDAVDESAILKPCVYKLR